MQCLWSHWRQASCDQLGCTVNTQVQASCDAVLAASIRSLTLGYTGACTCRRHSRQGQVHHKACRLWAEPSRPGQAAGHCPAQDGVRHVCAGVSAYTSQVPHDPLCISAAPAEVSHTLCATGGQMLRAPGIWLSLDLHLQGMTCTTPCCDNLRLTHVVRQRHIAVGLLMSQQNWNEAAFHHAYHAVLTKPSDAPGGTLMLLSGMECIDRTNSGYLCRCVLCCAHSNAIDELEEEWNLRVNSSFISKKPQMNIR